MTCSVTISLVIFFVSVIVHVQGQKLDPLFNPSSAFSANRIPDVSEFVCKEKSSRHPIVGRCEAFFECQKKQQATLRYKNSLSKVVVIVFPEWASRAEDLSGRITVQQKGKLSEYPCQYAGLVTCPKPEPTIVIPEPIPPPVRSVVAPTIQPPSILGEFICLKKFGRFAKPGQCDVYYECTNGFAEEKNCPDGLVFNPVLPYNKYPCQYDHLVDCSNRQKYQKPISTQECPHQYGFFRIGDSRKCGTFRSCVNGLAYNMECPEGLAFNANDIKCDWPDQVADCNAEEFLDFRCPEIPLLKILEEGALNEFYSSKQDCRKYFACVSGKPRLLNCPVGMAFDDVSRECISIANAVNCPQQLRTDFQ